MKHLRSLEATVIAVAFVALCAVPATGQTEGTIANVNGGGSSVKWDVAAANGGGTLTISFPDGRSIQKTFRKGESPYLAIGEKFFESPEDGVYTYELRLGSARTDAALKARGKDDEPESERAGRKRLPVPAIVQSGSFAVANGSIVVAGALEPGQPDARASAPTRPARTPASANVAQRIRNNHRAFFMPDQVIPDDLIVQGSLCVGLDCVNNEPFSFDTIRMKENNTRIFFLDTSAGTFPQTDWVIRANSSANGGQSFLGFVNQGNAGTGDESGTIIFEVDAGAPANSLRVSSTGNIGLGTATPVLDLHANTSDTPAFRLEQNNGGGFAAQTWDIAGNEANFFVRDVTSGSRLPFRIRPGAPTSSLDISATGNVGVNNAGPTAQLHAVSADNNEFAGNFQQTNAVASNGVIITTQTAVAGDTALHVLSNAGATTILSARNNGRVGIGTGAPDQVLSVNGDASKAGGGSWQVFSDERLKTIKGRFNTGLKAVMQLQPLRYEYRPNNALGLVSNGEHVGFGAQTLQKIIPEAITRTDGGYLMVNNDPIIWTMLNAIQEQQKQIAELKAEVRALKARPRRPRR